MTLLVDKIMKKGKKHNGGTMLTNAEKEEHHKLWELLVKKSGRVPTNAMYQKIADRLGVTFAKANKPTSAEKDKLYKKLRAIGYRTGSHSTDDELNWLHSGEVIYRKSDGAILQPFNSGDKVFTNQMSENLWRIS